MLVGRCEVKAFSTTVSRHYLPLDGCRVMSVYCGCFTEDMAYGDTFSLAATGIVHVDACISNVSVLVSIMPNINN